MRIMLISDHADPLAEIGSKEAGGQNIYVFYLAKFLSRLGFYVDVFTRWDRRNKKEIICLNNKVRIIRVKAGPQKYIPRDTLFYYIDEFAQNILKRIESEGSKYDIIHTNYWFSGLIGLKITEKIKIPIVHVFHSIGQVRFNVLKKFKLQKRDYVFFKNRMIAESKIAKTVDRIISTSPFEKRLIAKIFNIKKDKIKVIPIGVEKDIFKPLSSQKARKALNLNFQAKVISYVGRIEWRKGIGTLLYAFKQVIRKYPQSILQIIGGGRSLLVQKLDAAERERLQKICRDLNILQKVKFVGPVPQKKLYQYYSASDVVVVPSYYEPFGIVPLESMACGTPVVASRTGGLQFTVVDGLTGFLVKPRDYKELGHKICKILEKGKDKFQKNCLERIENNFLWNNIIIEYGYFLNQLLKESKK